MRLRVVAIALVLATMSLLAPEGGSLPARASPGNYRLYFPLVQKGYPAVFIKSSRVTHQLIEYPYFPPYTRFYLVGEVANQYPDRWASSASVHFTVFDSQGLVVGSTTTGVVPYEVGPQDVEPFETGLFVDQDWASYEVKLYDYYLRGYPFMLALSLSNLVTSTSQVSATEYLHIQGVATNETGERLYPTAYATLYDHAGQVWDVGGDSLPALDPGYAAAFSLTVELPPTPPWNYALKAKG